MSVLKEVRLIDCAKYITKVGEDLLIRPASNRRRLMLSIANLFLTNKDGRFWDTDPAGLNIKDLTNLQSGLFSLDPKNTSLGKLAKVSITAGSKIVFEKVEGVD